jgi:hypothetical protein
VGRCGAPAAGHGTGPTSAPGPGRRRTVTDGANGAARSAQKECNAVVGSSSCASRSSSANAISCNRNTPDPRTRARARPESARGSRCAHVGVAVVDEEAQERQHVRREADVPLALDQMLAHARAHCRRARACQGQRGLMRGGGLGCAAGVWCGRCFRWAGRSGLHAPRRPPRYACAFLTVQYDSTPALP